MLASGLVAAIALPSLARVLADWLIPMILAIMFIGALRLPPEGLRELTTAPLRAIRQVLMLQLALPLLVSMLALFTGWTSSPWLLAVALAAAAPSIMSSPNMAAIMGMPPTPATRLLVWGTLLVPVTALPTLLVFLGTASLGPTLEAALRLGLIIVAAGGLGHLCRRFLLPGIGSAGTERLDGLSAIALAVFVIALMPALGETFQRAPLEMLAWIAFAVLLNFGAQALVLALHPDADRGPLALVAGNRNVALMFAALPAAAAEPLLPFLAAYQIPMYLTPLLLGPLYARFAR